MGDLKKNFNDLGVALNIIPEYKVTYKGTLYEINLDKDKAKVNPIKTPSQDQLKGSQSLSTYKADLTDRMDQMISTYNEGLSKLYDPNDPRRPARIDYNETKNLNAAYQKLERAYSASYDEYGTKFVEKLRDKYGENNSESSLFERNRDAEFSLPGIKAEISGLDQVNNLARMGAAAKPAVPSP